MPLFCCCETAAAVAIGPCRRDVTCFERGRDGLGRGCPAYGIHGPAGTVLVAWAPFVLALFCLFLAWPAAPGYRTMFGIIFLTRFRLMVHACFPSVLLSGVGSCRAEHRPCRVASLCSTAHIVNFAFVPSSQRILYINTIQVCSCGRSMFVASGFPCTRPCGSLFPSDDQGLIVCPVFPFDDAPCSACCPWHDRPQIGYNAFLSTQQAKAKPVDAGLASITK